MDRESRHHLDLDPEVPPSGSCQHQVQTTLGLGNLDNFNTCVCVIVQEIDSTDLRKTRRGVDTPGLWDLKITLGEFAVQVPAQGLYCATGTSTSQWMSIEDPAHTDMSGFARARVCWQRLLRISLPPPLLPFAMPGLF